jgi:hypothetical protein
MPAERPASAGPAWTLADQMLWPRDPGHLHEAEVFSLSPSAASMTLAARVVPALVVPEGAGS